MKHDLKNPNFVIVIVNSTKARAKNEMKENAHIQVVWSSPVAKSMYGPKHGTMRERGGGRAKLVVFLITVE